MCQSPNSYLVINTSEQINKLEVGLFWEKGKVLVEDVGMERCPWPAIHKSSLMSTGVVLPLYIPTDFC